MVVVTDLKTVGQWEVEMGESRSEEVKQEQIPSFLPCVNMHIAERSVGRSVIDGLSRNRTFAGAWKIASECSLAPRMSAK